jgi:chromate reductase
MQFDHYEGLAELPHYNQDLDGEDAPESVRDLRRRITEADGVLIATPEYNYSIPGGLKNVIDWASRPAASSALLHKPVAIMGAAPTNFGSVRAQLALRQCFVWIDSRVVVKPEVIVFRAGERFDDQGNLVDPVTAEMVTNLLGSLRELIVTGVAD